MPQCFFLKCARQCGRRRNVRQPIKSMNGYTVMQSNHIKPEVNYREFRIHKLNTPEFSHVRLLLYWPIFGLLFLFLERLQPQRNYYPVYCGLDDIIPFCEWALIPYLFWFVFLIGTLVYTFFRRCTCISAYDVFCDSHLYDHGFDLPVLSNLPKFAARSICTQ